MTEIIINSPRASSICVFICSVKSENEYMLVTCMLKYMLMFLSLCMYNKPVIQIHPLIKWCFKDSCFVSVYWLFVEMNKLFLADLHLSKINSKKSKIVKKENPTNKPKPPPISDMNDILGYIQACFSFFIVVDAILKEVQKYL